MKKIVILNSLFLLIQLSSHSQTVNGITIKDINTEYIQIIGTPATAFGSKIQIIIDFGQKNQLSDNKNIIRDSTGKKLDFNSMIDALNFLNGNGYEFIQAYAATIRNTNVEHYYLMRKKK